MKKIALIIVMLFSVALIVTACQKKREQEQGPGARYPAGPVESGPMQTFNEIKLLQETVKKDPENLNAWIKLGNDLMDGARYEDAIGAYQKALALNPKDVNVRVDMGTCYRRTGKPEIAASEFRKAIEIEPDHVTAHKNLAVVLAFDLKDNKGAIKQFEKTLALDPYGPDAGRIKMEIAKLKAEGRK